jgi:3-oxoacyl-[acyl-carrier-protein] synthase II
VSDKQAKRLDPFCHYALAASDMALKDAHVDLATVDPARFGVFVSSGIGGILTLESQVRRSVEGGPSRVSPFLVPMMISDMAAGAVAMHFKAQGPNFNVTSACATGTHSIGEAYWCLRRGDADIMLAGGAEACISPIGIAGFCAMKALSERNDDATHASRPFDRDRDGFVIAEGAGVLVMETEEYARQRGARIYAEVAGYGASADAHHITAPCPGGEGAALAIATAMRHAGVTPEQIDYINAHGTSTPLNDKYETMAIKRALGAHAYKVPVSSTKALTGHALGAAGGLETIVCIKAINESLIPGTYNLENVDPECDLDYVPNHNLERPVRYAMNQNFGFGGHNGVVIVRKYEG